MNKVFKVIWNHATQSWVAVSELTSAKGKTKSKKLTALSVAVGSALVGTPALAAVYVNNQEVVAANSGSRLVISTGTAPVLVDKITPTTAVSKKHDYFIRIGDAGRPVVNDGQIIIGFGINNQSSGEAGDTIIGHRARMGGGNLDSFSTGVGYRIQSAGPSVSIGVGARSDIDDNRAWNGTENGGVAIGGYALQGGNKNGGVAIGAISGGDYNYITSVGALSGVGGFHVEQVKDRGYRIYGGNDGATSIGYRAGARGLNSVAVGREATTANFKGRDAVSVGYNTHSIGESSVALGPYAVAGGFSAAEITQLQTEKTRLEGVLTNINTDLQSAIDDLNANAGTVSTVERKFRVGQLHSAQVKAQQELNRINADLNRASATPTQSTTTAMAIGYKALANNVNATAIGRQSQASASSAVALGTNARVNANLATSAVAIGQDANVLQNSTNAIALGTNASVVGDLNGSSNSIAIGNQTAAGNRNARWGANNDRRLGFLAAQNATAVGSESIAGADNALTLGHKNTVNAPNSSAIGSNNTVGTYSNVAYVNNVASATYSGVNSHVLGSNINVTANNTVVIGNNILVTEANRSGSVVLGDNSSVPAEVKAVNSAKIGTENGKKLVYSGFAGNLDGADTDGNPSKATADKQGRFVSVGNATSPRQVKFVAAGEISATSTDAINGSQLYAFSDVVNNLAISTATIIGGNAVLNPNGTVSGFSQPLNTTTLGNTEAYTAPTTPATNVSTAITNLNNYVNAGWKIAEGDSVDAKARISPNKQVNFKADGLATVSVKENTTNNGADVTYSVQKGTFDTTTNGTVKANSTVGVVTNADVATAVNNSGWNTTTTGGTNVTVNPGDQVNYVNGNGTTANVTTKTVDGKDVVSVSYNVNQTKGSVNENGTVSVVDGNSFLNASTVANLVNNAAFNVTTGQAVDKFATQTTKTAQVKAGGNVTYIAGKNIAIEQDNQNFTFSTTQNVTFTNANVTSTLALGNSTTGSSSPVVNLKTENATAANVNNATTLPTSALNITSADGKPTQIKGVGSSLNTTTVATNPDGTDATDKLLDLGSEENPLSENVLNSVATVRDLTNLGWVVSANGNSYTDTVKNANEVKFNGVNGISVTGNTTDGVRNINISLNTTTLTSNANGTTTVTNGNSYVNGTTVADAINKAGWNTTLSNGTTLNVNPGDQVNYVNGNGTTANVTTKTVDGKDVVSVSYNVNQTKGSVNENGTVSVVDGNSFLNASTVANLVNNAAFNVTTGQAVDKFATQTTKTAQVKAGGNVTYIAGKNIAIEQDNQNFTFSTTKDIEVDSVTANNRVQIGSGDTAVNLTTDLGALQVADKDGNATQITNVEAGTNIMAFNKEGDQLVKVGDKYYVVNPETNEVDYDQESTLATEEELDELAKAKPELKAYVSYAKAASGLADLDNSEQTNALTVADAQRLGWVVSASGNDYADSVTNANEVRFNGVNGVSVTGNTTDGVRNINISLNTTTLTSNANGTTTVTNGNSYVNGTTVADAINKAGWNTTLSNGTTLNVNPGDQVNYVNGNGTTANVTTKTVDGKDVVSVSYNVNQTKGSVNENGTVSVVDGNSFLNASTVANLVNNAAFNVTTGQAVDKFATQTTKTAQVKAGGNVTYIAGKNIAIEQDNQNFTFSTTKDIEVDSVTANNRVQIGSGDTAVNLTTDLGALQVADKDGNATQITNVEAGTNVMAFNKEGDQLVQVGDKFYVVDPETNEVDFTKESTPATEEELDELAKAKPALKAYVAYAKAASGLADLDNSEQTNALTVADAQRLGWVVSASGNDYADSVTNANEVRFNGSNGISVTGETDEHGVRNINVSIAKGNVAGNTTTGVAAGDTNYVTGDQVANAINNSGWKTTATKVVDEAGNEIVDANKATAVNPGDSVNYVNGNSTKANVVVTKAEDGKETVNVSYDLVTEDHLTPVANDAKSVTKPTNIDAKGKDAATVNDVLNAGWNLQANDEAVDAVTHGNNVNFTSKDGSVKITATSNGSTSSLDFAVNATSIVNQVAGTISYKDGKATTNGDGKRVATVGDVANTINNTGWLTNVTDAKGNVTTKVVTPNTQVNYVNGDGTKANVVANSTTAGLDVTFNVKSANPETLTVDGNGVKVNTGSITEATDVAGDANRGKVTVATGEGNKVATVQNVANAINSASWTVKVADTQEEITTSTANDEGSSVRAGNEITHVAGKNLKVKRDGRNVTYALANDVSVNTVTAQNSITVGAGNAATTVTTSSAQDGVTEVKLADAAGKATRITNVAAGVKDTDAVNVSQLRNSNTQINQNIAHLNNKVNRMGKDLRAGIAGSNAAAGLPQVYIPGKSMVAAAAGTFKGQSAVAVGYSRASDNGKVILKLQGNANTRGDVGGSVGVGYQW